jgi:hypothetical protein
MVKVLVLLEALALEIAWIANHWLADADVSGAAAELQLPIWAVSISESGNSRICQKKYIIHTGALGV